jgi:hypothetical protein
MVLVVLALAPVLVLVVLVLVLALVLLLCSPHVLRMSSLIAAAEPLPKRELIKPFAI